MAVPHDDALAYRTQQVAALRGLLAERTAELAEARAELEQLRAQPAAPVNPEPSGRRWRARRSSRTR